MTTRKGGGNYVVGVRCISPNRTMIVYDNFNQMSRGLNSFSFSTSGLVSSVSGLAKHHHATQRNHNNKNVATTAILKITSSPTMQIYD